YQLPPVVLPEEEMLFTTHYASSYFFDAYVLRTTPYTVLQLTKVYRQQDATFINLLDAIRIGNVDQQQLATLNARYRVDRADHDQAQSITLVTTNAMSERINAQHLAQIRHKPYTFTGTITGTFYRPQLLTEETLILKAGVRIMMLNN